jgi:succinate dehydrogenase / fumarate reductase membrane anchor subunit
VQRFTAIGNVVTTVWFVASLLLLPNFNYITVHDWVSRPVPALALGLMIITTVWHARLGMQVMIEDYVHEAGAKFGVIALLNLAAFAAVGFGLLCVIRLALGA